MGPIVEENMMRIRKNVYHLSAGDRTLYWYGRAITRMRERLPNDPTSWRYQAAIHGVDLSNPFWSGTTPLPSPTEQQRYWNQCQHGTWYFLPWHRMYLAYFEQIVLRAVIDMGGPSDWALPFWDYSDPTNPEARTIPPAFTTGTPATNPLQMPGAGGLPGRATNTRLARDTTHDALSATTFVGQYNDGTPGFGGGITGFSSTGPAHGTVEFLPHDFVHVDIGNAMADTTTAGLDPIFWLHHANIDRLWQVWLNQGDGRANPTDPAWREFAFGFHDSGWNAVTLTPAQVVATTSVLDGYSYEGVPALVPAEPIPPAEPAPACAPVPAPVLAHSPGGLTLGVEGAAVALRPTGLGARAGGAGRVMLELKDITGTGVPVAHNVYLNLPLHARRPDDYLLCALPLFGIGMNGMAMPDRGLRYLIDVSGAVARLRAAGAWNGLDFHLQIRPRITPHRGSTVRIGAITLTGL
jgi:tyrosinase